MTKEQLIEMGLTEEIADKVWKGIQDGFVTKSRFNEVNGELKTAKETVTERDAQLQTLKDSNADVETLKADIQKLQDDNKTQAETHAKERHEDKVSFAVERALANAKAINSKAVKALLNLVDAKLDEDGNIEGLDKQIKALQEADDSKMLFTAETKQSKPNVKGFVPNEGKDGQPNDKPTSLSEAIANHYQKQTSD